FGRIACRNKSQPQEQCGILHGAQKVRADQVNDDADADQAEHDGRKVENGFVRLRFSALAPFTTLFVWLFHRRRTFRHPGSRPRNEKEAARVARTADYSLPLFFDWKSPFCP